MSFEQGLFNPNRVGGGGGTTEFKWRGWSNDFWGFEIFDSGILFCVGKFGKYFFGWLDLSGDLFGYSKQSEDSWYRGSTRVSWLPLVFFRVISFPALRKFVREFFGFCLKPKGFFLCFVFCPHSIIPVTWNPEYPTRSPPPPPRVQPVLSLGSSFLVTSPDVKSNSSPWSFDTSGRIFPAYTGELDIWRSCTSGYVEGAICSFIKCSPKTDGNLKIKCAVVSN